MSNLELELYFEQAKRNILSKIQKTKEKWERIWREALGNPTAETELIHLKLEIQIMEAQALEELEGMEEKIKRAAEDGTR